MDTRALDRLAGLRRLITGRRPTSIKAKLVLINAAALGAALAAVGALLISEGYLSSRRRSLESTQTLARAIGGNSGAALAFGDERAAAEILEAFRTSPDVVSAAIRSTDGRLLARYGEPAWIVPGYDPERPRWSRFGGSHLEVVEPVEVAGRAIGLIAVRSNLGGLAAAFRRTTLLVGLVSGVALAGALLLALRLHRAVTEPLGHLAALMSEVSHDRSYDRRAQVRSDDEIGSLARSFNTMLEQIQIRDTELGHELQERRRTETLLDELAHYDAVTGLPNRNLFVKHLSIALARSMRTRAAVALLFVDLDDFKIVNDTMGHAVGDLLLRAVGERFTGTLRATDATYRLGGDEFAVLLQDLTAHDQTASVARKLLGSVKRPFLIDGQEIYIGASVGISLSPQDGDQAETLLRNADAAMYHAKEKGKSQFEFFSGDMHERTRTRLNLETDLRRALERGELELHYQAQVDVEQGRIVGAEALLRWNHPRLGRVLPAEFIPVAEEGGLILPIGREVIRMACAQGQRWRQSGLGDLRIAVNMSARQFEDASVVDGVLGALAASGLPSQNLQLEVTEGVLIRRPESALAKMRDLKAMGVRLSLDDFGTGYSSIGYLKRFPIDELKIDRSFVDDLPGDPDDEAITIAILALARSLHLDVVAEGVETEAQRRFLAAQGCAQMQGYLFGRPLDTAAFTQVLATGTDTWRPASGSRKPGTDPASPPPT